MKKKAFALALGIGLIVACITTIPVPVPNGTVTLYAQSVPTSLHVQWQPNPSTDNVTGYTVTVDGATLPSVISPTVDQSCGCIQTAFSVSSFGAHVVTIAANNIALSTDPTSTQVGPAFTVNFNLAQPANVTGGKVTK